MLNNSLKSTLVAFVLASSSLVLLVRGQNGNFDYNQMMNQNCPNFKCSAGHTPVQKSRTKFESTGCSAMGGGSMVMNPGGGDGSNNEKPYESCCHQWHACYSVCGVSKQTCDNTFETCSKAACEDGDEDCTKGLELSNMMMKLSGCKKFDEAQYQSCECTTKEKALGKKEAAIRNFYKKNSPENVEKAKNLVAKADTSSKMAGLFLKLLLKYPGAIQIKEDPMKAMFDKIKVNEKDDSTETINEEDNNESEEEDKIEL